MNNAEEGPWISWDWEDNWWSKDSEEEGERSFRCYMVGKPHPVGESSPAGMGEKKKMDIDVNKFHLMDPIFHWDEEAKPYPRRKGKGGG